MKTKNRDNKPWHDSFTGKIFIGVIIGILVIFAGFLINKHIITQPPPQQLLPQLPQLKQSVQNQTSQPLPSKSKKNTTSSKTADTSHTTPPENKQLLQQPSINATHSNIVIGPANNITQTINEFPEPKFDLKLISANLPQNNLFETKALLTIDSKTALKNLYLEARAPSIVSLEAGAQRTGMFMTGHTGKRDGFAFTNLPDAWGQYMLKILSQKPEKYEIIYDYQ